MILVRMCLTVLSVLTLVAIMYSVCVRSKPIFIIGIALLVTSGLVGALLWQAATYVVRL